MQRHLLLILLLSVTPFALAQVVEISSPPGDKEFGEAEQIKARELWFRQSRGLDQTSKPEAALRKALDDVKADIANRGLGQNNAWKLVGPSPMTMLNWAMGKVAGRVTCFAYDPDNVDHLYLGTASGGVWKSTDGGNSWTPIFDKVGTQTIGSIYVQAAPNKRIWVGTGEQGTSCTNYFGMGVWVSHDEGASFVEANGTGANKLEASYVTAITGHANDSNLILAGGEGFCDDGNYQTSGLYRTTDAGQNWTQVLNGPITDIAYHPDNPNTYYASVSRGNNPDGGVYRSTDSGQTWTRLENGILSGSGYRRTRLAIAPSDPMTIYALVNRGSVYIYRSVDGGDTWTTQNTNACEGQCSYNLCISVHPTDPNTILVGTIRHSRSTDGGVSLVPMTSGWGGAQTVHQDTHVVYYDRGGTGRAPDPDVYWVGTDGGLWKTENSGTNYQHLNEGLNITQFYDIEVHPTNKDMIFGGSQDNSSARGDGNTEWNVTVVTGDGFMNAVDPRDTNIVYQNSYPQGGFPNIARSNAGGAPNTFSFMGANGITSGPFPWVTPMDISYDGSVSALFVGSDRIFRLQHNQSSWTLISGDLSASSSINIINSEMVNGNMVIYAGTRDGRIHRSLDAMAATPVFEEITANYPGGNVSDIAVDLNNVDRIFVTRAAFGQNKLYRSENGGTAWTPVGSGLPNVPANSVAIDPRNSARIFVGNDIGVFVSHDNGDNFSAIMNGMPLGSVVTDLEIDDTPYVLTAGTYGRSAWQLSLAAPMETSTGNMAACQATGVGLGIDVEGGLQPLSYAWSIQAGPNTSPSQLDNTSASNPVFTPTATGSYTVKVSITDDLGSNVEATMDVEVFDAGTYASNQISHWLETDTNPQWLGGFDKDGNGVLSVQDLIMELNNPSCQVVNN